MNTAYQKTERTTRTIDLSYALNQSEGGRVVAVHLERFNGSCPDWEDLDAIFLNSFRAYLLDNVAQSSAKTYCAILKAEIGKWVERPACRDYSRLLSVKDEKPQKIFLTAKELERVASVNTKSAHEELVRAMFLIGAYTGCRISDIRELNLLDVKSSGVIEYVSKKTSTLARVPASEKVIAWLQYLQVNKKELHLTTFNNCLRRICKRARINERVKIFEGGQRTEGEKWEYVSSHTARISFATNLAILKVPILDISKMMGHSDPKMTARYCVNQTVELSAAAMAYFK